MEPAINSCAEEIESARGNTAVYPAENESAHETLRSASPLAPRSRMPPPPPPPCPRDSCLSLPRTPVPPEARAGSQVQAESHAPHAPSWQHLQPTSWLRIVNRSLGGGTTCSAPRTRLILARLRPSPLLAALAIIPLVHALHARTAHMRDGGAYSPPVAGV